MKKIFGGLAAISLLAMLATSCGKESVETNGDGEKAIAFGVASGKQTLSRAAEAGIGDLESSGLTVWAHKDGAAGAAYHTFTLGHDDTGWSYSPVVYQPAFTLRYFSIWPAGSDGSTFAYDGTNATFNYDAKAKDNDLMVASASTERGSETADLTYKHILSQVNFAVMGQDQVLISVQKIKINDIYSSGTYTFGSGAWAKSASKSSFAYTPAVVAQTTGVADEIIYLGNSTQTSSLKNSNGLMMIPHTLEVGETLTFEYKITDMKGGSLIPSEQLTGTNNEWKPATVALETLDITEWEQSTRYVYVLVFDNPANPIAFSVKVDASGWVDHTNTPASGGEVPVTGGTNF